jgi:hypothetical protein
MRKFVIATIALVIPIAIVAGAIHNRAQTEIASYQAQVAKPKGFSSSPSLDNIAGGFTFLSDKEVLHLNEGTATVTAHGISNSSSGNGYTLFEMSSDDSRRCSVKNRKGIRFNLETMSSVPYDVDEEKPADFIFADFYRYPGQMKNRVQGSCGPVVLCLDGSTKVSKAPKNEALGDFYWKPVGGFIDKYFTSDGSRYQIAVRDHEDCKEDRTISIVPLDDGRYTRSLIGVAYDGRLLFTLSTPSGDESELCFGKLTDGKIVLEDSSPFKTSDVDKIAISLDGTLIAYLSEPQESGTRNIIVTNLKTMDSKVVGTITTTFIRAMMISPKNSYLALQLPNAIVWKKL